MVDLSRRGIVLVVLITIAALVGCTTPTTDPDAKVKSLITSTTWDTDTAGHPDAMAFTIRFRSGGDAYLDGDGTLVTWAYKSKVFTINGPLGTFTTTSPDIAADHFYFNYGEGMCYMIPLAE